MNREYCDTKSGQIYYEIEGKGDPIVCLHDMDSSSWEFQALMPLLSKKFKVIALDSLGFGISDPAPSAWDGIEDWAKSTVEFLDALKIKKATLLGHHTGAKIALEVAAAYPERVNKLILSGCGAFAPNLKRAFDPKAPWSKLVQTTTLKERAAEFKKTHSKPPEIPVSGLHIREMWFFLKDHNPDAPKESIQANFLGNIRAFEKRCTYISGNPNEYAYPVEARAAKVSSPTLFITGKNDNIRPPIYKNPDAVAKIIKGCRTVEIKGSGIMGPSVHAADYARAVLAFLKP
jgi:pimeloyl-ACP methyl ester carboxylesterase